MAISRVNMMSESGGIMTVEELITELMGYNDDLEVVIDGYEVKGISCEDDENLQTEYISINSIKSEN